VRFYAYLVPLPLIVSLLQGDFAVGAVLISFGAVLGKLGPTQLLWMTVIEVSNGLTAHLIASQCASHGVNDG